MSLPYPYKGECESLWLATNLVDVNRHRVLKSTATMGAMAASTGITVTQQALGTGGAIALATGAAAASATGIGLIVAGAVVYGAQLGVSARAAHKSRLHMETLKKIASRAGSYQCAGLHDHGTDHAEHQTLINDILPYVVRQKGKKFGRRVAGAIPIASETEMLRAGVRKAYKKIRGRAGDDRERAATWLNRHLFTHNCGLVQAIVSELLSYEEMIYMQTMKWKKTHPILKLKMKSV